MKKTIIIMAAFGMLNFYACDVEKTKEGEMPTVDVDIETESGELPSYDIDWVDVDLGTKTKMITVPKVEIVMEEVEVEVPYLNAKWPSQYKDVHEQTINVEAEVVGNKYDLEIDEVYAKGDKLIVISTLEKEDVKLQDATLRVSDQIVINAPDLTIKHYIVGDKPNRSYNNNYAYIDSKRAIESKLKGAEKIYG